VSSPAGPDVRCGDCGALVPDIAGPRHPYLGASAGCWELFGRLSALEIGEGIPGPERLSVHAYTAQHPGTADRRAVQSVWVHLVALQLILEAGASGADAVAAMQRLLAHERSFEQLLPVPNNYGMTVVDALDAAPAERQAVARRWATATWTAWARHHDAVRATAATLRRGARAG
jgi:hypothetical protein